MLGLRYISIYSNGDRSGKPLPVCCRHGENAWNRQVGIQRKTLSNATGTATEDDLFLWATKFSTVCKQWKWLGHWANIPWSCDSVTSDRLYGTLETRWHDYSTYSDCARLLTAVDSSYNPPGGSKPEVIFPLLSDVAYRWISTVWGCPSRIQSVSMMVVSNRK